MKSAGQSGRQGPREEMICSSSLGAVCRQSSLLFRGPQSFLLRPSTDWMGSTHILKGHLVYLKSTALNVNLILKISS